MGDGSDENDPDGKIGPRWCRAPWWCRGGKADTEVLVSHPQGIVDGYVSTRANEAKHLRFPQTRTRGWGPLTPTPPLHPGTVSF